MCVLFLFFVWGRVLELTCHFEIGNVKNHSCVPIACIMCALWVILSSWLRGKKKKNQNQNSVHFFGTNLVQFIFFSFLVMSFADIWLVWMRWVCEAASGSRKGWWAWVMSGWSRKGRGVESFSIPARAQGGWEGSGCGGQLGLRLLLEACWGCTLPFLLSSV